MAGSAVAESNKSEILLNRSRPGRVHFPELDGKDSEGNRIFPSGCAIEVADGFGTDREELFGNEAAYA